jgi:hypothetical protein
VRRGTGTATPPGPLARVIGDSLTVMDRAQRETLQVVKARLYCVAGGIPGLPHASVVEPDVADDKEYENGEQDEPHHE